VHQPRPGQLRHRAGSRARPGHRGPRGLRWSGRPGQHHRPRAPGHMRWSGRPGQHHRPRAPGHPPARPSPPVQHPEVKCASPPPPLPPEPGSADAPPGTAACPLSDRLSIQRALGGRAQSRCRCRGPELGLALSVMSLAIDFENPFLGGSAMPNPWFLFDSRVQRITSRLHEITRLVIEHVTKICLRIEIIY
jgi:hypothetical protein